MWVYAGRRLLLAIPTLLGASIIVFAMVHLAPGDPIAAVMPAESSKAEIEAIKHAYGFDKPLPVQYLVWLGHVARGDLGKSIATRRPVILDVRDALANSLVLALSSSLLAFGLGIGLGLLFILLGNFLTRVRPNWIMGIRTPWTLSSEYSWEKTHRWASRFFVGSSLATAVTWLAIGPQWAIGVLVVSLFSTSIATIILSYVFYKRDPDRVSQ